jgi:hypothetical protein
LPRAAVPVCQFEAARREIVGGWRAALVDDDVTILERQAMAAANHARGQVLAFRVPANNRSVRV